MMSKALSLNRLMIFVALCAVFCLMSIGFPVRGDVEEAIAAVATWTAPEHVAPVDHYVSQILVNDVDILTIEDLPSEYVSVEVVYGNKYELRVAGVDAQGNQGPYSEWSEPYTPELPHPRFF